MGSVGDSFDNALADNFFSTLKVELVYRTSFRTREQADLELFRYIDGWYNPTASRRHSAGKAPTSMRPPTTPGWQHNPHHLPSKPIPWAPGSPPSGKPGQPQEYQKTAAVTSSAISRGC
jgi:hypothetical protein